MTADVWSFRDFRPVSAGDVDLSGFEVRGRDGSIGVLNKATDKPTR